MSGAVAADVIVTVAWLAACLALPALFGRGADPAGTPKPVRAGPMTLEKRLKESGESLRVLDFFGLASITLGVMAAARLLGEILPAAPAVLWLTTIALVLGHTAPVRRLRGAPVLGNALIFLFLAGNGAQSLVSEMLAAGPALFLFALTTVGVHGIVIFGGGPAARLRRRDPGGRVPGEHRRRGLGGGHRHGPRLRRQAASGDRGGARRLRGWQLSGLRDGNARPRGIRRVSRIRPGGRAAAFRRPRKTHSTDCLVRYCIGS